MSTYMLWIILSGLLGNPISAGVVIVIGGLVLDQVAIGVLPSPLRAWRRYVHISRLQHRLLANPNDRRARFELAEAFVERRRYQRAVDVLKPALEAGDDDPHTLFVMGVACLGAGHHSQGETFLEAAEAQDPDFRMGSIDLERGRYRLKRGDNDKAIDALRKFTQRRAASVEGVMLLAQALEKKGDDAAAALMREEAWKQYVTSPSFQRRRERLWAWRARPSRPLMYGAAAMFVLLLFFRFAYPALAEQTHAAKSALAQRRGMLQQQQAGDDGE